jgi:hypothetical protein
LDRRQATTSRKSSSGFISMIEVEVNLPPLAAASHTSSNSSAREVARMIASLVELSAASMRVRRSFCTSVLDLSSAWSKFSNAKDTLSTRRCNSSANSDVNVSFSSDMNDITPTTCPCTSKGNDAPEFVPSSRALW